jgi:hypothetical protein
MPPSVRRYVIHSQGRADGFVSLRDAPN